MRAGQTSSTAFSHWTRRGRSINRKADDCVHCRRAGPHSSLGLLLNNRCCRADGLRALSLETVVISVQWYSKFAARLAAQASCLVNEDLVYRVVLRFKNALDLWKVGIALKGLVTALPIHEQHCGVMAFNKFLEQRPSLGCIGHGGRRRAYDREDGRRGMHGLPDGG